MTATITHLASFDSRPLTYAVTHADAARSFVDAADAATLVAALIPNYEALTATAKAARAAGNRRAAQKARRAMLEARRESAHALRVTLQRRINDEARADGRWATLTDDERTELTRAATGRTPVGIVREEETWIAGIPYLVPTGRWDAVVPLVVSRCDYCLLADGDTWNEEPTGDSVIALDATDDDAYVASLEAVGVIALTDGNAVA